MRISHLPAAVAERYTGTAIVLHWLLAVLLIAVFLVGLSMTGLPFSPQRVRLYNWHKWAGMVVLMLSAVRLLWRLTHRPPPLPAAVRTAMPGWQQIAHRVTHVAFYGLFFVVPLLGWAYSSAAGFPVVVFGVWPLPDFVPTDKALAEWIKPWHRYAAYALAVLVLLHVAAALKHQFIDRDGLLARMAPRWR